MAQIPVIHVLNAGQKIQLKFSVRPSTVPGDRQFVWCLRYRHRPCHQFLNFALGEGFVANPYFVYNIRETASWHLPIISTYPQI